MKAKIELDLSDLGVENVAPVEAAEDTKAGAEIDTSNFGVPISLSLMIQPVHCQSCGQDHYEHQGLTLELKFPMHRAFRKLDLLERHAYTMLPRRLEYMPMLTADFCRDCFVMDQFFNPASFAAVPEDKQLPLPLNERNAKTAAGRALVKASGVRLPATKKHNIDVSDL